MVLKRTLGLLACIALLPLITACPGEDAPAPAPAPDAGEEAAPAEEAAAPAAEARAAGELAITGVVNFEGEAPSPRRLRVEADPYCAENAQGATAQDVLVSDGKLRNVLVHISGQGLPAKTGQGNVKVDQTGCLYQPRVQCATAGQTVEIHNSDGTMHNVHTRQGGPRGRTIWNRAQMQGAPAFNETFRQGGSMIHFGCDVHPWMEGYLFISDNGYCAVTGEDGTFTIDGLGAGEYTVTFWHEKLGEKTETVTVTEGEGGTVEVSFGEG
jgi:plastocyanin